MPGVGSCKTLQMPQRRKIKGCFKEVLSGCQGYLNEVELVFEGVSKVFQRCFKEVLGEFRETFKGDSGELLGI